MNALKELNQKDLKYLQEAIVSYFKYGTHVVELPYKCALPKFTGRYAFKNLSDFLGLAYTSSSDYAGLWVCNIQLSIDAEQKLNISGFGVEVSGRAFVVVHHTDTEEIFHIYI